MTRKQLSKHFTVEEFDCHDGTQVPPRYEQALVYLCETFIEPLRERFGPCTVLSGFRTGPYNVAIGGARYSYHVYTDRRRREGVASDLRFARGTPTQWAQAAKELRQQKRNGRGGIGVYVNSDFIHVDTRDYQADWTG